MIIPPQVTASLVDQGMKVLQQLAYPVRSEPFAERGEPDRSMKTIAAFWRTGWARKLGSRVSHSCMPGA